MRHYRYQRRYQHSSISVFVLGRLQFSVTRVFDGFVALNVRWNL